jgi:CheY-like chemotaxis protein
MCGLRTEPDLLYCDGVRQPERRSVVLVADDDALIRDLMLAVIADEEGLHAVLAADGAEALAAVEAVRPTVILLDMQMPRVDGAEVARRLKADPATRDIPIVGLSASERKEAALAAGCDAFVAKPFMLDDLLAVLHECIRHGGG